MWETHQEMRTVDFWINIGRHHHQLYLLMEEVLLCWHANIMKMDQICSWLAHAVGRIHFHKKIDQLYQSIIKPRMIRPMKTSKWSNGHVIFSQGGTMNRLDTWIMTNVDNFDWNSSILNESEARFTCGRPNVNAIITKSHEEGKISHFIANAKSDFSLNKNEEEHKKLHTGTTCVLLESTMIL